MEKLFKWVASSDKIRLAMRLYGFFVTPVCVFSFSLMFFYFLRLGLASVLGYIAVLGVPYLVVSLVRRLINAPRPYEMPDFSGEAPKEKKGSSFPSRHAFSAFAIGTLCLFVNPVVGVITLVLGAVMCLCRVALRIHFIRDVLCGAIIGVITSLIGAVIII